MLEKYTSDRVVFARESDQRKFLLKVKRRVGNRWEDVAKLIDRHPRTIRDWANGKYRMSYPAMRMLAKSAKVKTPSGAVVRKWKEHLSDAGKTGGLTVVKKRGGRVAPNENYRLEKWQEWWDKTGKNQSHPILNKPLAIRLPRRSIELAEFVGIVLGDGGISSMQVVVTLHRKDDREYSIHVRQLIKSLFGVVPGVHKRADALADNIVVSRVALVRFCIEKLGLKQGNKIKQQVDIPPWIQQNSEYLKACVRGLVDTDGSVFNHRYKVNGKLYSYKKLSFTSASLPLIRSVFKALRQFGLHPRMTKSQGVRLDSKNDMRKYFTLIGSNNEKHLKRYRQ